MSNRELQRGGVLARVKAGGLRLKDAAELMRSVIARRSGYGSDIRAAEQRP